jgi:hypothetical protein
MLRLLFLAGAAAFPAMALAAPAPAPAQGSAATRDVRLALGRELVAATTPLAAIRRDSAKTFEANFRRSFLASDKGREMERRLPGLLDAMAAAGVAECNRVVDGLLPWMMDEAGTTYADGMSEAELRDALAFYATGLGRKLVALIPEAVDAVTMRVDFSRLLTAEIPEAVDAATKRIDYSRLLTADERRRFAAFSASPAGRRMSALDPVLAADTARTIERGIAAEMERINARVAAAGRAFVQAHGVPAR